MIDTVHVQHLELSELLLKIASLSVGMNWMDSEVVAGVVNSLTVGTRPLTHQKFSFLKIILNAIFGFMATLFIIVLSFFCG